MEYNSPIGCRSRWYKYLFLVFSLALIACGIRNLIGIVLFIRNWYEYAILYFIAPLAVLATLWYLRFFLPKYADKFRTATPFLTFLALSAGLAFVRIVTGLFDQHNATGNSFAWWHWFSGVYFQIAFSFLGLLGLLVRHKIGWICLWLFPCYMAYSFVYNYQWYFPIRDFYDIRILYSYVVYCLVFPVICCFPVIRDHFRVRSAKELLLCLGIAAIIGISIAVYWHEYVKAFPFTDK